MAENKYTRENAIKILLEAGVTEEWANDFLDNPPSSTEDKIMGICGNPKGVKSLGESGCLDGINGKSHLAQLVDW